MGPIVLCQGHCVGEVLCKCGGLSSARCIQQQLPLAIPAARREDYFFLLNCYASDYSHIWHKLLLTAWIHWRDNIYHVQCLVGTDVQIHRAALHSAEEMGLRVGGGYKTDPCTHLWSSSGFIGSSYCTAWSFQGCLCRQTWSMLSSLGACCVATGCVHLHRAQACQSLPPCFFFFFFLLFPHYSLCLLGVCFFWFFGVLFWFALVF